VDTFEISTPSLVPLLIAGAIALTMIAGASWFLMILVRARNVRFVVTDHALEVKAPLYGRTIPKAKLKLDEARIVKLSEAPELRPVSRRNALGLPGVRLGWFRLAGVDKALVFIARGGEPVLHVPTTEGYPLVLETREAEELLAALRS
jgi:hypothetical protein